MIHAESVGQQSILRLHHVDVTVTRKLRMQSVARLARFAVADSIGEHNEKFCRIERLIFSEKFAREFRPNKLRAAAGCSMHNENGVPRLAPAVVVDLAQRSIVDSPFGQSLTRRELEIADRV